MNDNAKSFLKKYLHLVDIGDYTQLFKTAALQLKDSEIRQIVYALNSVNVDTLSVRENLFIDKFMEVLDAYIHYEYDCTTFPANEWSRFDYMIQVPTVLDYGLSRTEELKCLVRERHRLGLKMIPLSREYWWDHNQDYDLGWFDKSRFIPI